MKRKERERERWTKRKKTRKKGTKEEENFDKGGEREVVVPGLLGVHYRPFILHSM